MQLAVQMVVALVVMLVSTLVAKRKTSTGCQETRRIKDNCKLIVVVAGKKGMAATSQQEAGKGDDSQFVGEVAIRGYSCCSGWHRLGA